MFILDGASSMATLMVDDELCGPLLGWVEWAAGACPHSSALLFVHDVGVFPRARRCDGDAEKHFEVEGQGGRSEQQQPAMEEQQQP